jgi:hypothetical protein
MPTFRGYLSGAEAILISPLAILFICLLASFCNHNSPACLSSCGYGMSHILLFEIKKKKRYAYYNEQTKKLKH